MKRRSLFVVFHDDIHFGNRRANSREWGRAFTSKRAADSYARGCTRANVHVIRVTVLGASFPR